MELWKRKRKTVNNYLKPHKCSICKKAFCHEYSLKQHSVDVHDEKKAQISKKKNKHLKDKNVAEVEDISDHYLGIGHLNDNEKRIIKAYEQDMELRKRKRKTVNNYLFQTGVDAFEPLDEKNRYECLICETGFAQNILLEQHKNAVHEEKKAFECSVCDGHFDSERILKMHIFTVHGFMRGKDFLEKGV